MREATEWTCWGHWKLVEFEAADRSTKMKRNIKIKMENICTLVYTYISVVRREWA